MMTRERDAILAFALGFIASGADAFAGFDLAGGHRSESRTGGAAIWNPAGR